MRLRRPPMGSAVRLVRLFVLIAAAIASHSEAPRHARNVPHLAQCTHNTSAEVAGIACGPATLVEATFHSGSAEDKRTYVGPGGNVNVISGTETAPLVTQAEHQVWANGNTVVVHYNDFSDAATNSGVSYSTDGGLTFTRIVPPPFKTGHGTNRGDPTVVYSKKHSIWIASDLANGCGTQGIGLWTSPDGIVWSAGPCAHIGSGTGDDRQSMAVDNNPVSPYYGNLYVTFNNYAADRAPQVIRSTDGGANWSAPITLFGTFRHNVQIQTAPDGTVLAALMNDHDGGLALRRNYTYRSTDGGVTWSGGIAMGAAFFAAGDSDNPYGKATVNPIWSHVGYGDLAAGDNNVVVYSYAATGGGGGALIPNGGFETGSLTNWAVVSNHPLPTVISTDKHSGTYSAKMGTTSGVEPTGDSSIYSDPIVLSANPGYLSFWWRGTTLDDITHDSQFAYLTDTAGNALPGGTIFFVCETTGGWVFRTFNLDPFKNQTIRIKFQVHQDGFGDYTSMFVDDVVIGATGDSADIYTVRSTDNGATWAAPVRVDGATPNNAQWMPSTAGGKKAFLVSWYDRRNSTGTCPYMDPPDPPYPPACNYERWGAMSRDGGVTWSPPQRISDQVIPQPRRSDVVNDKDRWWAGDYMRSFFDGTTFYDAWTDGRDQVQNVGNQQNVYLQRLRAGTPYFDFDNDSKTDLTVWRPSNGVFYSALSGGGASATGWGASGDFDVVADYDGDGTADVTVWRPSNGTWYIVQSHATVRVVGWGMSGDIPMAGDVDGDGKADLVIFRPSTGAWYALLSTGGSQTATWGTSTDQPLLADFDGDGKSDFTIFRSSTGGWYSRLSGGGTTAVGWGTSGDVPVAGDYDGDGKADLTVFRPSSGTWWVLRSSGGVTGVTWGTSGDIPVSSDTDADGLSDMTVWRPTSGVWFTQRSGGGSSFTGWGISGDKPSGRPPGT